MDRTVIVKWIGKYRYVLLVLLVGVGLMLLPPVTQEEKAAPAQQPAEADLEKRLEQILGQIEGAGAISVLLTEAAGEEMIYQTDGDDAGTVLVSGADRSEQGLVRTRYPPTYRGAVVVCAGADSPAVRLAVVEAVSDVTGLGSDKITVVKME